METLLVTPIPKYFKALTCALQVRSKLTLKNATLRSAHSSVPDFTLRSRSLLTDFRRISCRFHKSCSLPTAPRRKGYMVGARRMQKDGRLQSIFRRTRSEFNYLDADGTASVSLKPGAVKSRIVPSTQIVASVLSSGGEKARPQTMVL